MGIKFLFKLIVDCFYLDLSQLYITSTSSLFNLNKLGFAF
jgi:hypothetical protein